MPYRLVTYQWITRAFIRTLGFGGLLLGLAMLFGGPERFSSPGFATARLVPGGVYSWGAAMVLAGGLVAFGVLADWQRRVVVAGLGLQAAWFLFFATSLTITTLQTTQGAVTGPFAYGTMATLCILGAVGGHGLKPPADG